MKRSKLISLFVLLSLSIVACGGEKKPTSSLTTSSDNPITSNSSEDTTSNTSEAPKYFKKINMPSLNQVANYTEPKTKIADVPDLLILEVVTDTIAYADAICQFEYVKIYNNTSEPYNLKGHRLVLANPTTTLNNKPEVLSGNAVLQDGFIYQSMIYNDEFIKPFDIALLWVVPYYWDRGQYTDVMVFPETFEKTVDDFKTYWKITTDVKVIKLDNQPVGGGAVAPSTLNGTPVVYATTHINGKLLRTFEIQKFDNEKGTYKMHNRYEDIMNGASPIFVGGRFAFNTLNIIKKDSTVVDNEIETRHIYWKPIVRSTFLGRVDPKTLDRISKRADFTVTSNPGVTGWEAGSGLQFTLPEPNHIMMKLIPLYGEEAYYRNNVVVSHFDYLIVASEHQAYKNIEVDVPLAEEITQENPTPIELYSDNRLFSAAPTTVKVFNLLRSYN